MTVDLRLRCVTPSAAFDVALEALASHSMAEVRAALVEHTRQNGFDLGPAPRLTVNGRSVIDDDTVFSSGIASGDEIGLGIDPVGSVGHFGARVAVVSGPDAGAVELLGPGRHTVGRAVAAEVALTDQTVATTHAHVDLRSDGAVRIVPADGEVLIEEQIVTEATLIEGPSTARVGGSVLELSLVRRNRQTDALGTVPHNRTPYRRPVVHPRRLADLDKPPDVASKPRFVLASALLPVASGGILVAISGRIEFLFLVLLSPLLMGWSYLQDRRSGRRRYEQDKAAYERATADRLVAGESALDDELIERLRVAPPIEALAAHVDFLQARLWERDRSTPDFGQVRVGRSSVASEVTIEIASGGDDELVTRARQRLAHLATLSDAPVTVSLPDNPVLAVVGDPERHAVARAVVARAAMLHSPEDLVIAAAVSPDTLSEHDWMKWLPHVRASSNPVESRLLTVWADEHERLLAELAGMVEHRVAQRTEARADTSWPRVMVLIDEGADPDRTVLSRLLDGAGAGGVWVVWIGATPDGVPRQAGTVLHCGGSAHPSVLDKRPAGGDAKEIYPDCIGVESALEISRSLAPVRDATSASQIAALPRTVTLFDVLSTGRPTAESVQARWRESAVGLAAPVGVSLDGTHVLDLVEDGPHALVAGTSGAGKSEFLSSWVASLAVEHPPERLSLLFIDYKGGAFSGGFEHLPHNVGAVTNLDESLSLRALTSLRAELDRRMELLGGAKDLTELTSVDPMRAPPRLVIVVDEFATLVQEIPDFVAGMVDLAQRGRSLGIHLVLATQRPSGSVNDNILANTNLRVSLRVLDSADSTSVIGSPDAATLPAPLRGRAFARTGPGQLVPFQSAYSGASDDGTGGPVAIAVGDFDFSGVFASGVSSVGELSGRARTNLEVTVAAIIEAHRRDGSLLPVRPWLHPLPEVVRLEDLEVSAALTATRRSDPGRHVLVGLADRPDQQLQEPFVADLEASGGMLVVGSGGSGRTTLLRTIAADLCSQAGGDGVVIHAIDAAGRALGPLAALAQVASVVGLDELEPVARLIEFLEGEIATRRRLLADADAESLTTLRAVRGELVVPRIVVLVDGLAALRESLDTPEAYEWFNRFVRLVIDGRPLGVHLVAASDRRAGLPAALVGSLGARVVLRTTDADEAISLGVPRQIASSDLPVGRGHVEGISVQVAVVGDDPSGPGQAAAIAALADRSPIGPPAPPLPGLPDVIGRAIVVDGFVAEVGQIDLDRGTATIDLSVGHLLVAGPAGSGRSVFLAGLAAALSNSGVRVVAIGGPASPLSGLSGFEASSFARLSHAEMLTALAASLDPDAQQVDAVVLVDTAEDVVGMDTERVLEQLGQMGCVRLVAAADTATVARTFSGWLAEVKRHRRTLLLQPERRADVDAVLGIRAPFRPGQTFPPGRGLLVSGRDSHLVQLFMKENEKH